MAAMKQDDIISALRAHEGELKQAGIASLSLIGSVARGEDRPDSDVDVASRISDGSTACVRGWNRYWPDMSI
jgi:predicted nucleotidyltransferase